MLIKYAEEFQKDKEKEDELNEKIRGLAVEENEVSTGEGNEGSVESDQGG